MKTILSLLLVLVLCTQISATENKNSVEVYYSGNVSVFDKALFSFLNHSPAFGYSFGSIYSKSINSYLHFIGGIDLTTYSYHYNYDSYRDEYSDKSLNGFYQFEGIEQRKYLTIPVGVKFLIFNNIIFKVGISTTYYHKNIDKGSITKDGVYTPVNSSYKNDYHHFYLSMGAFSGVGYDFQINSQLSIPVTLEYRLHSLVNFRTKIKKDDEYPGSLGIQVGFNSASL